MQAFLFPALVSHAAGRLPKAENVRLAVGGYQ